MAAPVVAVLGALGGAVVLMAVQGILPEGGLDGPARPDASKLDFTGVLPPVCRIAGGVVDGPASFRALLADPEVAAVLADVEREGWTPRLDGLRLSLDGRSAAPGRRKMLELALAEALVDAAWRPWTQLGTELGLVPDPDAPLGYRGARGSIALQVVALSAMPLTLRARVDVGLSIPGNVRFRAVNRVQSTGEGIELTPRGLSLVLERDELVAGTRKLLEVAEQILRDIGDPWVRFVEDSGFEPVGDGAFLLAGRRNDVRMQVWREGGQVRFTASLNSPLPPGTLLIHADHGKVDLDLHDPILDPLLTIQTSDLPALSERIAKDTVRGELLDVVHGAPGSFVEAEKVVCVVKAPYLALDTWADKVAALVHALG